MIRIVVTGIFFRYPYHAKRYLQGRGIHPVIIDYCIEHSLLFETAGYHNAVFVGYDKQGIARYAAMRGTKSAYKGEVTGSDKHFSFSISPAAHTEHVHLFESAIDLLSYATLELFEGRGWKRDALLSLAGVFQTKRKDVVPIALSRYLDDYRMFNMDKPEGFAGRSLSVSDVVEVVKSDEVKSGFYYCDSIGFQNVPFDSALAHEMQKPTITVVLCEPGKAARTAEVGTSLEALQTVVGGCIEAYYPFEEQVCIVCNDEGKFNGMSPCRAIYGEDKQMIDTPNAAIISFLTLCYWTPKSTISGNMAGCAVPT